MVRETWAGLGYYRRAANLHRLAQDGRARPRRGDPGRSGACWSRLPGIGRYTAGAVASFAYERATPAIDTNVARVIRRAFHPRLRPAGAERPALGDRRRDHAPPARRGRLGIQSGDHGARRAGLHREGGAVRRMPGAERLCDGEAGAAGAEPVSSADA